MESAHIARDGFMSVMEKVGAGVSHLGAGDGVVIPHRLCQRHLFLLRSPDLLGMRNHYPQHRHFDDTDTARACGHWRRLSVSFSCMAPWQVGRPSTCACQRPRQS